MTNRRVNERGGAVILVCFSCITLGVMAIAAATLGRLVVARRDAQQAADAVALSSIEAVRVNGRQVDLAGSVGTARLNARLPIEVFPTLRLDEEAALKLAFADGVARTSIPVPRLIVSDGELEVTASATAQIGQEYPLDAVRDEIDVVLLLDYSGAMEEASIDRVRTVVRDHINLDLPINFGAVFFGPGLDSVEVDAPGANAQIIGKLEQNNAGARDLSAALERAADILVKSPGNEGELVMLITDGKPSFFEEAEALDAAERIWDEARASIFTVHLGNDPDATEFLIKMSGAPASHPDAGHNFNPESDAHDRDAFARIFSLSLCPTTPLDEVAEKESTKVQAFLFRENLDTRLTMVELLDDPTVLAASFSPTRQIIFSIEALRWIVNEGFVAVARYRTPRLIQ
jgi:hypothetical protein